MRTRIGWYAVVAGALMIGGTACGDDDVESIASPQELAASLLTVEELGEGWTDAFIEGSCPSPDDCEYDGVVSDEMQADLQAQRWPLGGLLEECTADKLALDDLPLMAAAPQALRAFDKEFVADANPAGIEQALLAGNPDQLSNEFGALTTAIRECLAEPAPPEENVVADELTLPDLGDERFGFVIRIGSEDRWDIRAMLVRQGSTLLILSENEFPSADEQWLTDAEVIAILEQAVDKLG